MDELHDIKSPLTALDSGNEGLMFAQPFPKLFLRQVQLFSGVPQHPSEGCILVAVYRFIQSGFPTGKASETDIQKVYGLLLTDAVHGDAY